MPARSQIQTEYFATAREPWPSLLFILPFLLIYEVGVFLQTHSTSSRNGADLWIRHLGTENGISVEWLFPLLAPLALLIWHFVGRRPGKWSYETLAGMFAESLMFAMLLVLIGQGTAIVFPPLETVALSFSDASRAVSFFGAGIYEEMLFRLGMLPLIYLALRCLYVPRFVATGSSVIVSSWIFAAAHYVESPAILSPQELTMATETVLAQPSLWFSFTFRLLAGVMFSILFWARGFGIAVGAHVLYDLFVGVILTNI